MSCIPRRKCRVGKTRNAAWREKRKIKKKKKDQQEKRTRGCAGYKSNIACPPTHSWSCSHSHVCTTLQHILGRSAKKIWPDPTFRWKTTSGSTPPQRCTQQPGFAPCPPIAAAKLDGTPAKEPQTAQSIKSRLSPAQRTEPPSAPCSSRLFFPSSFRVHGCRRSSHRSAAKIVQLLSPGSLHRLIRRVRLANGLFAASALRRRPSEHESRTVDIAR